MKNTLKTSQITLITLNYLDVEAVTTIVSKLLSRAPKDVAALGELVHKKTGGAMMFVSQFLRLLYDRKLIIFSMKNFRWEYLLDRIQSETDVIADNVVQLLCDKISSLPKSMQIPITTAAFLGFSRFDAEILLQVMSGSKILNERVLSKPEQSTRGSIREGELKEEEDSAYIDVDKLEKLEHNLKFAVQEVSL